MAWTVTDDGLEIYYEDTGEGDVLVFQSGYMGIHDIWKYQIGELSRSFRCITHDNRGYGLSSKPAESSFFTMERNVEDTKQVLEAVGINEPCVFVTHSLGGMMAVAFDKIYPEMVKAIIMMNGSVFSPSPDRGANEDMWATSQQTPSESMMFYNRLGLKEEIAIEAGKWQKTVFRNQTRAFLNYTVTAETVKDMEFPVLVVYGKADPILISEEIPRSVARAFPNGDSIGIEGLKHFPQTQEPGTINRLISEFCGKL